VIGSTYTPDFPLWSSSSPREDKWAEAVHKFKAGAWDPAFFLDDDGRLYLYHGSSNAYPLYGQEIDRATLQPTGSRKELISLHDDIHGWERFGEANDNTFLRPFIEGAWMTKHGGNGNTYQDLFGNWWHTSTITIAVKNNFERRIGIWPADFDKDGVLYCNTAYGDYPHYLPNRPGEDHLHSAFAGWMLLNYAKPVKASSTLGAFAPNLAVDEDLKTYWSAASGNPGEWFESDLGGVSSVRAIQVNYADQDADIMGKVSGLFHQYRILASADGQRWQTIVDKSGNKSDVPHDFVELPSAVEARFIRMENIHMPTGKFALSGLRVFGRGHGSRPEPVKDFVVLRGKSERRNAWLKWRLSADATGYVIYSGIHPDKLYTSIMVYGANEYYFRAMDREVPYFFRIEAFNESGISERSPTLRAE
jgi:hypothetical protein